MLIVAGGQADRGVTDTTEMFEVGLSSQWTFLAPLPAARAALRGVTVDNKVFMTGQGTAQWASAGGHIHHPLIAFDSLYSPAVQSDL